MALLRWALVIILCLDLVFFLGQYAVSDVNPAGTEFFSCNDTQIGSVGNCNSLTLPQEPKIELPGGTLGIEPATGNIFTDIFTSISDYVLTKTGVGNIIKVLSGPGALLHGIASGASTPENAATLKAWAWAVGALWYGITFFLLISFLWGRQGE